jgi:hypothetical protein
VSEKLQRARAAWSALDGDQRFAGFAAGALLVSMFLPWYQKSLLSEGRTVEDSISAFGAVSFVEAAIFLVAVGVLALVLARGEGRPFQLPGGDGTVIFAAGVWATLLIFYRVFDKPDVSGPAATIGIQWGFFVAFVAAGALAFAGHRLRLHAPPAPPVRDEETAQTHVAPPDEPADTPTEVTEVRLRPGEVPPARDRR